MHTANEHLLSHAPWRTYTPADGLAALHVEQISQDRAGRLWFTFPHTGVGSFDGDVFRSYSSDDGPGIEHAVATLCDRQGRLWVALKGVSWFDGQSFHPLEGVPTGKGYFLSIHEDQLGRIWFCGPDKLCCYDGIQVQDLTEQYTAGCGRSPGLCWGMAHDQQGNLWIGGEQLVCYDGSRFESVQPPGGTGPTYVVVQDAGGVLWAAAENRIWCHDGTAFKPHDVPFRGRSKRIRCDNEGRLWICTGDNGVYCLADGSIHHITSADGLASNSIDDVFQDREGILWFATFGAGISCCDPVALSCFGGEESTRVRRLVANSSGDLWLGLESGLASLRDQKITPITPRPITHRIDEQDLQLMCAGDHDSLWLAGNRGGLAQVAWDLPRTTEGADMDLRWIPEFDGVDVTAVAPDEAGRLLLGLLRPVENTQHVDLRLVRWDGHQCETLYQIEMSSWESRILRVRIDATGCIWFVAGGWEGLGGDGFVGCVDEAGAVTKHGIDDGLIDIRVEDLLVDAQRRVWVATRGGVCCLEHGRWEHFDQRHGLPASGVLCLCEDHRGTLWFGAEGGVVRYHDGRFQFIRSPSLTGPIRDIIEDRQGRLWFATGCGVVSYQPMQAPPLVHLECVIADRTYEVTDTVELPDAIGQVCVQYKAVSTRTDSRDVLYIHRLLGLDDEWSVPGHERQVTYPELPVGEYTFEVIAIDRDLNESEPARAVISVVPNPRIQGFSEVLGAGAGEFVGHSSALRRVQQQLVQIAHTDLTVLILGETGTGKGLVARSLHAMSTRAGGPLIQVNCGSLPDALVESELFGHERGAFTGAHARKLGRVELASGGTLFLDEIGDLGLEAQVKLLHLLEERTFERVGGGQTLSADVRIVAATNRDLPKMIEEGVFREDLYYRLQVFPVHLPALRERLEDIELLAVYFAERMATHLHKPLMHIESDAFARLRQHNWPGNVRELEHVLQRAVISCQEGHIRVTDLALPGVADVAPGVSDWIAPEEYERRYLRRVLEATNWVIRGEGGAAAQLGMAESTLRGRLRKLHLERP